jgi:hypothetical protein
MSAAAHAGSFIDSAVKIGGNTTPINLLSGGLTEGVEAYTDRTHLLLNIPSGILGADLVQVSNSDKTNPTAQVDVTLKRLAALYLGLDDRQPQPKSWMSDSSLTGLPGPFFDTGTRIDIDEGGNGDIDQTFSPWVTLAPAGTYQLLANEPFLTAHVNNYLIFATDTIVTPEPGTFVLTCIGLLGFSAFARRR